MASFSYELQITINFWAAYLEQAKKDLLSSSKSISKSAKHWFASESYRPTSFLWVCDVVDCDPEKIRKEMDFNQNGNNYGKRKRYGRGNRLSVPN